VDNHFHTTSRETLEKLTRYDFWFMTGVAIFWMV